MLSLINVGASFPVSAVTSTNTEDDPLLFKKFCTPCHGLPSPESHAPGEWRSIIFRMQNHRLKRGYKPLNENEIELLVNYLDQQASKQGNNK